ncbi:aminoglycoside phosphotransferase family protein [Streptomyces sp. NPDC096176]|uniref:aminoglycoside phosphotransferase family protein n=1 Tax=Streptomyces sp. NPDC096176 TaxID=3366079 RepID=UPI003809D4FA
MPDVARSDSGRVVDSWESLYRTAAEGTPLTGYYHRNYCARLPPALARSVALPSGAIVKLRAPITDAVQLNLRIWPEDEVLGAIKGRVADAPRVLADRPGFTVHSFAAGRTLADLVGDSGAVGGAYIESLGELFRQMAAVPPALLPACPDDWPRDGDCAGFLRTLVDFTETEVKRRHGKDHKALFSALQVPDDAFARLLERAGSLGERPFVLLHTDIHRGNLIVGPDGRLSLIDWELALFGDPVYEIASHLSRMRYAKPAERRAVGGIWRAALRHSHPAALAGHRRALRIYLDFERLQSVHIDVIRLALGFATCPDPAGREQCVAGIEAVLRAARRPLGMRRVPSRRRIAQALAHAAPAA